MKTLTDFLNEGINSKVDNPNRDEVVKWIDKNYKCLGLKISNNPNEDGLYEVMATSVELKNKNISSLTNGMFVWIYTKFFSCSRCKNLTSLDGAPSEVDSDFYCYDTAIKDLTGAPNVVGGDFNCSGCNSLVSLEGSPVYIGGDFDCSDCGINFTENDVKIISKVKGEIIC